MPDEQTISIYLCKLFSGLNEQGENISMHCRDIFETKDSITTYLFEMAAMHRRFPYNDFVCMVGHCTQYQNHISNPNNVYI